MGLTNMSCCPVSSVLDCASPINVMSVFSVKQKLCAVKQVNPKYSSDIMICDIMITPDIVKTSGTKDPFSD